MDKEQLAIARLQDAAKLSEHRYKKPLMVTYSGGKDSQVLVALAERLESTSRLSTATPQQMRRRRSILSVSSLKRWKNMESNAPL